MQSSKPSIFFFYGEEDYLIEERIKKLKDRLGSSSFNIETLDSDHLDQETLCNALQTQTLLGGDKLVIIRGITVDADSQELFLPALQQLTPGVTVILQAEAVDQRSKFYRFLADQGEVIECRSFAPWEQDKLVNWIKAQARGGGKKIADSAARLFQEISGNNLRLLAGDLEKIITYIGSREEITAEDVLALASPGQKSVFDLLDALRAKNLKQALIVFQVLLKNKEELFPLLSTIAGQYRLMLQIKSLPAAVARDPRQIAATIKGHPFFIKKCLENIGQYTLPELKQALETILAANLKLKTGAAQPLVFELMLTSLCGK